VDEEFPKRLRQLRESKHPVRSMEVTGGLMGLSTPGMLRRYERGEAEPSASALVKMADYYHVSVDYLLGRCNY
jgi:transcriptional regulator with XRE-family HTH domain